ncbi:hypothetical protein PVAP13_8NG339900 [Panicum virgatum]|uniref:Uncharacterized protein n=1 Tax=Panicum virgatum TaxID=38727 RepID=A0A8T0PCX0_PANVG|nr:hypothetical protein PVAP13_8NG339900 [Panicum virgatum]
MGNAPATSGGGSCSTSTIIAEKSTGSHILRVDGYSGTKGLGVGKSLNSGTFTAGGHSWYIAYFPDGEDEECADWVSVYLYLDRPGPGAKDSAVKARFEFSLQDRNGSPLSPYRNKSSAVTTFSLADGGARCSGHKKFIQMKDFVWWSQDSFRIRCDVTVVKNIRIETTAAESRAVPPPDLGRNLGELLDSQLGADVEFVVGGEVFMAHRIVLAARSSVFKAELYGQMKEKYRMTCIQIDDMDPRVFNAMLHFIYTDSFPNVDKDEKIAMAQHLLVAADRYNLERLNRSTTAVATMVLAEPHGCRGLKEECFRFLKSRDNLTAVTESDDFENLMRSCPSLLKELLAKVAP